MSFVNRQPVTAPRRRSSSAVRSESSYNTRPRSLGSYSSNTTPYSSPYSNSSNKPNMFSSMNKYDNYGVNYQSPYFPNTYRGSTTGSLKIPSKALSNSLSKSYHNSDNYTINGDGGHRSRKQINGYSREPSLSRSRNSLSSSGMGSRSISLTSLHSEGYSSGTERNSRSRISSISDIRNENGEIDYKKLYEQQLAENDRLKEKLKKSEDELRQTKQTLEKINVVTSKNSLSELEKRERRAMERKLSEMEEELKQLQKLKAENERLKADNRSLTRVINKLTNSTKK